MRWANFIHIYQPANQAKEILEQVVNQSYRRIFRGLLGIPNARLTLNISAALSELLMQSGFEDVVDNIKTLAENGQLEFTETAKFHAFLPYLSEEEIERQIRLNHETNKKIFGDAYNPTCFFPPEMAYEYKVAKVVSRMGYKLIILDEIAFLGKTEIVPYDKVFGIKDAGIGVVFRERRLSNVIISAVARNVETFLSALGEEANKDMYLLTAMDGETFGHHRPGLEEFFLELIRKSPIEQIFVSEISARYSKGPDILPVPSTWASSEYDIENKIQFKSWRDEENLIHKKQWEFFGYVLKEVKKSENESEFKAVREKVDIAMASDQYFWASNRPWWSLEMIEYGAWLLLDTIYSLSPKHSKQKEKAKEMYHGIIGLGFDWQRKGKIRKEHIEAMGAVKIPFKERTLEAGKPEVYNAFIDLMKREMTKAAVLRDYEQAILWRDSVWKLETKNDVYDAVRAVDLLRYKLPLGEIEALMDKYRDEYRKIRGGQAEERL